MIANIELKNNTLYGHIHFHQDYDIVQDYMYELRRDDEPQERNVDTPPTYAPKSHFICVIHTL